MARILGESGGIFVDLRFLPSLINATCRGKRGHGWAYWLFVERRSARLGGRVAFPADEGVRRSMIW